MRAGDDIPSVRDWTWPGLMHRGRTPVLVVNAGSTSTKLAIVGDDDAVTWSHTTEPGEDAMERAFDDAGAALDGVVAVGHRIVHGGARFVEPVVIDADVVAEIDALAELAPLHNDPGLAGIRAARAKLPDVPQVACFDTAFHATMPDAARGVRRAVRVARRPACAGTASTG